MNRRYLYFLHYSLVKRIKVPVLDMWVRGRGYEHGVLGSNTSNVLPPKNQYLKHSTEVQTFHASPWGVEKYSLLKLQSHLGIHCYTVSQK